MLQSIFQFELGTFLMVQTRGYGFRGRRQRKYLPNYFISRVHTRKNHVFCSNCYSFGHWEPFQVHLFSSDIHISLCMCVKEAVSHFLTFWHYYKTFQAHYLPVLYLILIISPRSPGAFNWRMILEIKVWVLGVFTATVMTQLLGPLS